MRLTPHLAIVAMLILGGAAPASAQISASELVMRLEALENQIRQLTGQVERLQHRNQQLEQQVRRTNEDTEYRLQELGGQRGGARPAPAVRPSGPRSDAAPQIQQDSDPRFAGQAMPDPRAGGDPWSSQRGDQRFDPQGSAQAQAPVQVPQGRRGDAFDPNAHPDAPGFPRPLGSLPAGQPSAPPLDENYSDGTRGRDAGAPLDLSTLAGNAANDPALQPRGAGAAPQSGMGRQAAIAPQADSPQEQFDLGYRFMQRRDYTAAEQTFRDFLDRFPGDRQASNAQYWLGESFYLRKQYQEAAEAYLEVTTKFDKSSRAPDALLRLGQSLAALGQKEMACASFAEIERKFPRSSDGLKRNVEREQKRARC